MTRSSSEGPPNELARQFVELAHDTLRTKIAMVFAAVWTIAVVTMTTLVTVVIAQQAATLDYKSANAEVLQRTTNRGQPFSLRYRFLVGEQEFEGSRMRAGSISVDLTQDEDVAFVRDLPQHELIEVFYDASDPSKSVVRKGVDSRLWIMLAGTGPFWLLAIGLWVGIRWARRRHCA